VKAAVLGSPIAHSLSPLLHRTGYASLGLDEWSYQRFELTAADLPGFLAGLDESWRGFSLTMPLKQACLEVADEVTALAARAGAGNTLVRTESGWRADNTDIPGLVAALRPAWQGWTSAAVLGAGATARSAILALDELGVISVTVYARRPEQIDDLICWAASAAPGLRVTAADLGSWISGGEPAVISTLPAGAVDGVGIVPGEGLVFDAVYAGWPTELARAAEAAGRTVVGGAELLLAQALLQFEQFTGVRPNTEVLRRALAAAIEPKIVLVGFMGAGKTTVGRVLATWLGRTFVDTDELIAAAAGRSIAEIFAEDGEPFFRRLEAEAIIEVLTGAPAVVSLGGGAVGTRAVREALAGHRVVFLDVGYDEALARVGADSGRPVLARPDLPELYAARQGLYREVATVTVASSGDPGLSHEELAEQLTARVLAALS